MTGTETKIIKHDLEGKPLGIDVVTGEVDRPYYFYRARLKGEASWRLFIAIVGWADSHQVEPLIKACNRAVLRKQLTTDEERRTAAFQYAGVIPTPVKSAKPHNINTCRCTKCFMTHCRNGCRKVGCKVCFG